MIDEIAKQEGMDRSTIMRRFLSNAVREWVTEKSLKDYGEGKITLWQVAEKCNISLWEAVSEVKERTIHVPYGPEDLKEYLKEI